MVYSVGSLKHKLNLIHGQETEIISNFSALIFETCFNWLLLTILKIFAEVSFVVKSGGVARVKIVLSL